MERRVKRPRLTNVEVALPQEIVDDEFIIRNITVEAIGTAITEYGCRNWQA
jgi:hypothetical protein